MTAAQSKISKAAKLATKIQQEAGYKTVPATKVFKMSRSEATAIAWDRMGEKPKSNTKDGVPKKKSTKKKTAKKAK
jgi:hypothetical protein